MEKYEFNMLRGDFHDLPTPKPNMVKIFLSSTFADFAEERNYVLCNIYPRIREICLNDYQLDLIFIDMRWGITDESTNDNLTTDICMEEIKKCQSESLGPSFIALLSHRYGTQFLKSPLEQVEFEQILNAIDKLVDLGEEKSDWACYKDVENILTYCYELDRNQLPNPYYKIKSVLDITTGLGIPELNKEQAQDEWYKIQNKLFEIVNKCVLTLFKSNTFSAEQKHSYFASVTEKEIEEGLFKQTSNENSFVYFREITDAPLSSTDKQLNDKEVLEDHLKQLKRYIQVDAYELLDSLRNKIYQNMEKSYIKSLQLDSLKFTKKELFKGYLCEFDTVFTQMLRHLIQLNVNKKSKNLIKNMELYHHAFFCNKLMKKHFLPREEITQKINEYLMDDENRKPFIMYGESGSGKSSIMASIINNFKIIDERITTGIIRFMGTSKESSTMKGIYKSILNQLNTLYNLREEIPDDKEPLTDFRDALIKQWNRISETIPNEKILILLDSIDQLSPEDYYLEWMIFDLPKNMKMIYSTLPKHGSILDRLKVKLNFNDENYLEINGINLNNSIEILSNMLKISNRKLTLKQVITVEHCLELCNQIYPLHLKLISDITSKWSSKQKIDDDFKSCICIKDTVKYLFKGFERKYGRMLFSRCVFYLTIFENGISESELEDVLSIDDEVLTSIFQYHEPPTRRFPIGLWIRIKHDLRDYLTEKEADSVTVVTWFHRAFFEASRELYNELFEESPTRDALLMNIIDYFTEKWNKQPKPFDHNPHMQKKLKKKEGEPQVRITKSQKIQFKLKNNEIGYNKRKLNELLNILLLLNNKKLLCDLLLNEIYLNYEFMYAKAKLKSLDFIIDANSIIQQLPIPYEDKKTLINISDVYRKYYWTFIEYPHSFGFKLDGQLSEKSELANRFVFDSLRHCGLFIPYYENGIFLTENYLDLYRANETFDINGFYCTFDCNILFVLTQKRSQYYLSPCNLYAIDTTTTKLIGKLTFPSTPFDFHIVLNSTVEEKCKRLSDLKGFAVYKSFNNCCMKTFDNDTEMVLYENDDLYEIRVLSEKHIYMNCQNYFEIFSTETKKVIDTVQTGLRIKFSVSNITPNMVYETEYDQIDLSILIIGLYNNQINVYKFSKDNGRLTFICLIDSIQFSYAKQNDDFVVIDRQFLCDQNFNRNKNSKVLIRFAVVESNNDDDASTEFVSLINVFNDKNYEIIRIDENYCGTIETAAAAAIGYDDNKKWLKLSVSDVFCNKIVCLLDKTVCYYFDLDKPKRLEIPNLKEHGAFFIQENLLFSQRYCYQVLDEKIIRANESRPHDFNSLTNRFTFRLHDLDNRILYRAANSICMKTLDVSNMSSTSDKECLKIKQILSTLVNDDHIFVQLDDRASVIDILSQKQLASFKFDSNVYKICACDQNYFLVWHKDENALTIYKIEETSSEKYKFLKFTKILLNIQMELVNNKHLLFEPGSLCFKQIEWFLNTTDIYIVIKDYQTPISLNIYKVDKFNTKPAKLYKFLLNELTNGVEELEFKSLFYTVTQLSGYLIMASSNKIIYKKIETNENILVNDNIDCNVKKCVPIPNTDNLMDSNETVVRYFCFYNENNVLSVREIDINEPIGAIIICDDNNHLILTYQLAKKVCLFKLNEFLNGNLSGKVEIKRTIWYKYGACVTHDSKYLLFRSKNTLFIHRLSDFKEIVSLELKCFLTKFYLNKKYLSLQVYDSYLTSFMIIDVDDKNDVDNVRKLMNRRIEKPIKKFNSIEKNNEVAAVAVYGRRFIFSGFLILCCSVIIPMYFSNWNFRKLWKF